MSRERRSNELPGLADRGYSSFVIGYCLEKPLPPLLGLKMLSQCNGLVFLLLVYGLMDVVCFVMNCVLLMSEGNESVRAQYWSLALVSYILYAISG
jgi:hypothetical protein